MTSHRRTAASTFAVKKNALLAMIYFTFIMLPQQTTTIDAYSILPSTTRGMHSRIRWTNERKLHHEDTRNRRSQSQSSLSLPTSLDTSLRAFRKSDYLRNTTSESSFLPESSPLDQDDIDQVNIDEDDLRLLRFMEEALLELESFQSSSDSYPDVSYNDNYEEAIIEIIDRDAIFAYSSENKDTTLNREVSLLFPQTEAGATTNPDTMSNDGSVTLSGSDVNADDLGDEAAIVRARWLLVAAAALYGTNFSVVKLLGDEMPVGISTSLRFGLAALATLPWLVQGFLPKSSFKTDDLDLSGMKLQIAKSDEENRGRIMATMYGLEVGLWNSIGYVAQAVGLETTLASESAFLCSMAVVIVPLLDWIAGKKLLSRQWVGALMALVGVAFLELGDIGALLSSHGSGSVISTGSKLSLIQPFTFGLGFWRMEQAMHQFPQEAPRMTAAQLMAIFISSVGYCLWTMGAFEHFSDGSDITLALAGFKSSLATISTSFPWKEWSTNPSILFSLFWTGCITTALTIYMETLALESLSAAETTLIFSTEPLWGTAFAVAIMGEQMGMNSVVGAGLILSACLYSNLGLNGLQEMWTSTMKKLPTSKKASMRKMDTDDAEPSVSRSLQIENIANKHP